MCIRDSYGIATINDNKWHSLCLNVHDNVLNDAILNSKANLRYKMYVESIDVKWDRSVDLFIDDIFIWRDAASGRCP